MLLRVDDVVQAVRRDKESGPQQPIEGGPGADMEGWLTISIAKRKFILLAFDSHAVRCRGNILTEVCRLSGCSRLWISVLPWARVEVANEAAADGVPCDIYPGPCSKLRQLLSLRG